MLLAELSHAHLTNGREDVLSQLFHYVIGMPRAPGACGFQLMPCCCNCLKAVLWFENLKPFLPLQSLSLTGVDSLAQQESLLISLKPRLLKSNAGVGTYPVVLLFAVFGGRIPVAPKPVLSASRVHLQQKSASITDSVPFALRFCGFDLGVS